MRATGVTHLWWLPTAMPKIVGPSRLVETGRCRVPVEIAAYACVERALNVGLMYHGVIAFQP